MKRETWKSTTYHEFVKALMENNAVSVEIYARQLIRNLTLFIMEIREAGSLIPEEFKDFEHCYMFVNIIYSITALPANHPAIQVIEAVSDHELAKKLNQFIMLRDNETAISLLFQLSVVLRREAMVLTSKKYRSFRAFVESPIHVALSRGIGENIISFSDYPKKEILATELWDSICRSLGIHEHGLTPTHFLFSAPYLEWI